MSLGKGLALVAPWVAIAVVGTSIGGFDGAMAATVMSMIAMIVTMVIKDMD